MLVISDRNRKKKQEERESITGLMHLKEDTHECPIEGKRGKEILSLHATGMKMG